MADREEISRGLAESLDYKEIAVRIGRDASIVSREVARHGGPGRYRATAADQAAEVARSRPKVLAVDRSPGLRSMVAGLLRLGWSPASIAGRLAREVAVGDPSRVSHEAIYQWVYAQPVATLRRELIALRTGRTARRGPRPAPAPRIREPRYLEERPAEVEGREVPGHWEGDLVIGKGGKTAVSFVVRSDVHPSPAPTLFERPEQTNFTGTLPHISSTEPKDSEENGYPSEDGRPSDRWPKELDTEADRKSPWLRFRWYSVYLWRLRRASWGFRRWQRNRSMRRASARSNRLVAEIDEILRANPSLVQLARNHDANAVLAFSGGRPAYTRVAARELFVAEDGGYDSARGDRAMSMAHSFLGTRGRQNAAAAIKTLAQNQSQAIGAGRMDLVWAGMERTAGDNVFLIRALADMFQELSRANGRADLGGDWMDDEIQDTARNAQVIEAAGPASTAETQRHVYYQTVVDLALMDAIGRIGVVKLVQGHVHQTTQLVGNVDTDEQGTLERMLNSNDPNHRAEAALRALEIHHAMRHADANSQRLITDFFARIGLEQADSDLADWLAMRARLTGVSGAQLSARARINEA